MTLDAAEIAQVTEIAARVSAETSRNLVRGTGGATLPLPVQRLGTVGGRANAGAEVQVRPDGDLVAVPAINNTGMVLEAGDRVVVEWRAPSGVYVVYNLARASRGNWTPVISGPSSNNSTAVGVGHYTRHCHRVTAYGYWQFGASSAVGTAPVIGGLPFPVISDGDSIPLVTACYIDDVSVPRPYPVTWIVGEGATGGQVWWHNALGAAAVILSPPNATTPMTWAAGDRIYLYATYDTDAA